MTLPKKNPNTARSAHAKSHTENLHSHETPQTKSGADKAFAQPATQPRSRAPSAWEANPITSPDAHLPCSGTAPEPDPPEIARDSLWTRGAGRSVWTSRRPSVVLPPPTFMSARDMATPPTEPSTVISRRRTEALTPLIAEAWRSALAAANLASKYPSIPTGIARGFHVGIPPIPTTRTPPNSPSFQEHISQFDAILSHELSSGRYLGPFPRDTVEALIGPFQSSPLSIIAKPHKPNAYRLIQNFSHPHTNLPYPSINSAINSDDFPCTWGTFNTICVIIWNLPKNAQAAVRDVAEAYRTIPLYPSQWPGAVVRTGKEEFCIDTAAAFGVASNAGAYGHVADAGADIMRSRGLGPISKWVDDHVFLSSPPSRA
ncbi:hypothetical protein NLI96_g13198 [Meripilus lineatus]|uniref:Uncharacterized protein n=1 Tax=Meripilus lineatus TaxID=2056292 RepID=A0AAD5UNI9_9APHY|nr:hypothetical protein NLI96_g13198 [Physisporinus lineatus]